ncbi:MAG: hypothetical protein ACM3PE_01375 [Deltaproteobacteria bacterium]
MRDKDNIYFHGIIEEQGLVVSFNTDDPIPVLLINASEFSNTINMNESVAVNGVCLTVQSIENGVLTFHLWPTTLKKTNLCHLKPGMAVNLERNRY